MPSGNKPLPEPMLNQISVAIRCQQASCVVVCEAFIIIIFPDGGFYLFPDQTPVSLDPLAGNKTDFQSIRLSAISWW